MRRMIKSLILILMITLVFPPVINSTNNNTSTSTSPEPSVDNTPSISNPGLKLINYTEEGVYYPSNWSFIEYLRDNPNEYEELWEPWLTKAAIHAITTNDNGSLIAVGGGYLFDNEVHLFAWNYEKEDYDRVWDSGDGIIRSDVVSLAFGDTDNNRLSEIVAGSADGHIYVFEQRHVYDPITNTENMYDNVWESPYITPVWSVDVFDADLDFIPDIIAGTLGGSLILYEYEDHSGYPYSTEHWIEYESVWSINFGVAIYSIASGDTDGDGLPNIIVGLRNGTIVVLENNGTAIPTEEGSYIVLPNDNEYRIEWVYSYGNYRPILDIATGDTDGDGVDEASIVEWGKEAYILDYNYGYSLVKLYYPPRSYEMEEFPIDYWVDWMISGCNVYYYNGTWLSEPIANYTQNTGIRFNNTAMGGPPDGEYSQFLPNTTHDAWAILDFGIQEEAVGDGTINGDIFIKFINVSGFDLIPTRESIGFFVSQDGKTFVEVSDYYTISTTSYAQTYLDIDPILRERDWSRIRYIKIVVYSGHKFAIDAIGTRYIDKQVSDVSSTYIGILTLGGIRRNYVLFGSITGKLVAFAYNESDGGYTLAYDSYISERFSLGTNIWDIARVMKYTSVPYWNLDSDHLVKTGKEIVSVDYTDVDGDGYGDLLLGTQDGVILYYRYNGTTFERDTASEYVLFNGSSGINVYPAKQNLTAVLGEIIKSSPGRELLIGFTTASGYKLYILKLRGALDYPYKIEYSLDLGDCEVTGRLYSILAYSTIKTPITMDIADWDSDGDIDIVLEINGRLYMLWNILDLNGDVNFVLDSKYFEDINNALKMRRAHMPQIVDIQNNGYMGLILSFKSRNGSTYFENIGSVENPEWVEKKQLFSNSLGSTNPTTNYAFAGYTMTALLDGQLEFVAYKRKADKFSIFKGATEGIETLALATYPLLSIVNIAPITSKNFGYHILDVWSNIRDLDNWTQTISFGDMDGDGKYELIVGDYDSNVFVFEHITNNTYKIAYKTPDLYYEIVTNETPYYGGAFEGLSGTFKRRIWDHARFLVAGVDMDNNGKEEFVVATTYQIYVYEHIGYENYRLKTKYSLMEHPLFEEGYLTKGITAFAYAGDMDYDNYGELAIASGSTLLVLEMSDDGFSETFSYLVGMFSNDLSRYEEGKYSPWDPVYILPGNPLNISSINDDYSSLEIQALEAGDLDHDGKTDIVIAGYNRSSIPCYEEPDGFIYIIEYNLGTYYLVWSAPKKILESNPIKALEIVDMDYDGNKELIVGGEKGIDIFEVEGTSLSHVGTITSNPDHATDTTSHLFGESTLPYDDSAFLDQDIVVTDDGKIYVFFVSQYATDTLGEQIYYVYSDDGGETWSSVYRLAVTGDYGGLTQVWETLPRAIYKDGYIYVVWYAQLYDGVNYNYSICFRYLNMSSGVWSDIELIANFTTNFVVDLSIWRYEFVYYSYPLFFIYDLGASYIGSDGNIYLLARRTALGSTNYYWGVNPYRSSISYIYNASRWYGFIQHDIAMIDYNEYAVVFKSQYGDSLGRIYFSITSRMFDTWTEPTIPLDSYNPQRYPKITYQDGRLVVSGMEYNHNFGWRPFFVVSDTGESWSSPKYPSNLHPKVVCSFDSGYPVYYYEGASGTYPLGKHYTYAFTFDIGSSGAIAYSELVELTYDPLGTETFAYDIVVKASSDSSWIGNRISSVNALFVGDSDGDSRMEIFVGSGEYAIVYELSSNSGGEFRFYEKESILVNTTVNDVGIWDINGDGWGELVVSGARGNVYVYGFKHSDWLPQELMCPVVADSRALVGAGNSAVFGSADTNGDGYPEYYAEMDGSYFYVYDYIHDSLNSISFSGATILDVVEVGEYGYTNFFVILDNGSILLLKGATLVVMARNSVPSGTPTDWDYGYGSVFVSTDAGYIYEFNTSDLSIAWSYYSGGTILDFGVSLGGGSVYGVAILNSTGYLRMVRYSTSSISWVRRVVNVGSIYAADINYDGYEEILAANYSSGYILNAYSVFTGELFATLNYKTSRQFIAFYRGDVDLDGDMDILAVTVTEVIAIDPESFTAIWHSYRLMSGDLSVASGDHLELISVGSRGVMLYNSYGISKAYFWSPNDAFLVADDLDGDNTTEMFGLLENGTFIVLELRKIASSFSGLLYYTSSPKYLRLFTGVSYGYVASGDFDGDGQEDAYIYNGTTLVIYSIEDDSKLAVADTSAEYLEVIPADLDGRGLQRFVVMYNESTVVIYDIMDDQIYSYAMEYEILRVLVGHFHYYDRDSIIVVTTGKTYGIVGGTVYTLNSYGGYYAVSGDFDGDGYLELAYKTLGTTPVYAYITEIDGTLLWSYLLSNLETHKDTMDIFVGDFNSDGGDDLAFYNVSDGIYIYSKGTLINKIKADIPSPAIQIATPKSGTILIKYLGYGTQLMDTLGTIIQEFLDASTSRYHYLYTRLGDTYIAMTPGKIYGFTKTGDEIYISLPHESVAFATLENAKPTIIALQSNGEIAIIILDTISTVRSTNQQIETKTTIEPTIATHLLIILVPIWAVPIIRVSLKKAKKKN